MRRERKGNIIFAVLFCVAVLAFFVLMNISEIMDYSKIEAAGKKSLLPVDIKQETRKRRYKGRTTQTTKNYVKFVVEINNKKKAFWMPTSHAYGQNTPSAGIAAVSGKKKIDRYIFYTEDHIYYSEDASTVNEYIRESIKDKILVYVLFIAVLGVVYLIVYVVKSLVEKVKMRRN